MAQANYIFPASGPGVVGVTGVFVRSGVPASTGDVVPAPLLTVTSGEVEVDWSLESGETPAATVALDIGIDNPSEYTVQSLTVDWGDGTTGNVTAGILVAHPGTIRVEHVYEIVSPVVTVTAEINSVPHAVSVFLPGLPVSSDFDVDQIRFNEALNEFTPRIMQDWADVTGVADPVTGVNAYERGYYSVEARVVNELGIPEFELTRSSWYPVGVTGHSLQFRRVPKQSGQTFVPVPQVQVVGPGGRRYPDGVDVTLSKVSGPGSLTGEVTKSLYDGLSTHLVGVDAPGSYIIRASATGYPDVDSDSITVT